MAPKSLGYLFELRCLQCGHKFQEKLARLETNPVLSCPGCKARIVYSAGEVRSVRAQLDRESKKAVDDFLGKLGKLGKLK